MSLSILPCRKKFKSSREYATYIARKFFCDKLDRIEKGASDTYFIFKEKDIIYGNNSCNAKSLIEYAILNNFVDISDMPRNLRIEEKSYFIMAMRQSRYNFEKRFAYLKLYLDDIMSLDESEYSKKKWFDVFCVYTDEALHQCVAESLEMTQELRYEFIDFVLNLPYEIRKKYDTIGMI